MKLYPNWPALSVLSVRVTVFVLGFMLATLTGCSLVSPEVGNNPFDQTLLRNSDMAELTVEKIVNAPLEQVFASWSDNFGDICKFHPSLNESFLLEDSPTSSGLGAARQCNLKDGKNWVRERVVAVEENEKIVVDMYDGTMPLKKAVATIDFARIDNSSTKVWLTIEFEPKMGILGKAMVPMMKMKFRPMLQSLLEANAAYVEDGTTVNQQFAMNH